MYVISHRDPITYEKAMPSKFHQTNEFSTFYWLAIDACSHFPSFSSPPPFTFTSRLNNFAQTTVNTFLSITHSHESEKSLNLKCAVIKRNRWRNILMKCLSLNWASTQNDTNRCEAFRHVSPINKFLNLTAVFLTILDLIGAGEQ